MDPLSALGIAAAVVQFVDFSSKLIIETYGAYKSADGASKTVINQQQLADDLEKLTFDLTNPQPHDARQSADEAALQKLAQRCGDMARELQTLLNQLRVESRGVLRTWDAFHKTLKRVAAKGKIEGYRKELDEIRSQLSIHMLKIIKNTQSSLMRTTRALMEQGDQLHIENGERLDQLKQDVLVAMQDQMQTAHNGATSGETRRVQALQQQLSSTMDALERALTTAAERIESLRSGAKTAETTQLILKSLRYKEMPYRHKEINEAYDKTFSWIFEDNKTMFPEWLRNGSGSFWMRGKPGSGKSTLMKLLGQSAQTEVLLEEWSGAKPVVVIKFYFWNAGLPMQKTQQGLLQSLLLQILRKSPHLVPACFPRRWTADRESLESPDPWNRRELLDALAIVLQQDALPVNYCLFIDGLDEFERSIVEGDHDDLVKTLAAFEDSPSFKICVSSRPWDQFSKAYANAQGFVLQDYTRDDVEVFVRGRLNEKPQYQELAHRDPKAEDFIAQILDKAQGVFLWVWLIVGDLLHGLSMEDDIADLQRRLDDLPSDLADYFRLMLDRADKLYQERAACLLLLLVKASPLTSVAFWYINLEIKQPNAAIVHSIMPGKEGRGDDDYAMAQSKRFVNQWCRDMVECHESPGVWSCNLDFVHRTVKDFLETEDMQRLLHSRINRNFESWRTLMHTYLYKAKVLDLRSWSTYAEMMAVWQDLVVEVLCFAVEFEKRHQESPDDVMRELNKIGEHYFPSDSLQEHWTAHIDSAGTLMSYAVAFGLTHYVKKNLASDGTDQLDFALLNKIQNRRGTVLRIPDEDMLQILLDAGANVNAVTHGGPHNRTPWHRFLRRCYDERESLLFPIAYKLLSHGAAVDVKVMVGKTTVEKQIPLTPKVKATHTVRVDDFASVSDCLFKCCTTQDIIKLDERLADRQAELQAEVKAKATTLSKLKQFMRRTG